ncbi:probable manganese-transporting ATPase PDR2 [Tanacetum coccineum]
MAFCCGRWISVSGTDLVHGDVVSVCHNGGETSVPADMLILAGSAIVSETVLTGKSTPQWKVFLFSF